MTKLRVQQIVGRVRALSFLFHPGGDSKENLFYHLQHGSLEPGFYFIKPKSHIRITCNGPDGPDGKPLAPPESIVDEPGKVLFYDGVELREIQTTPFEL